MRATRWMAVGVLCAGLLGACGDDDDGAATDETAVAVVVKELETAARDGDGARICDDLFTENLRISVQRASKQACADEVKENVASETASFEVSNVKVNGDNATAQLADEKGVRSDVLFQREDGGWRIARIAAVGS